MNLLKNIKKGLWVIAGLTLIPASLSAQSYKKAVKAGKTAMSESHYTAAIESFSEAITFKPDDPKAYVLRADAYEKNGNTEKAANDLRQAAETDPSDAEVAMHAGLLYYQLGKYEPAIASLNLAIKADAKMLEAYNLKFNSLMALKNYKEALLTCEQAFAVKKTADLYYNHGRVSEIMGQFEAAEEDYRNAAKKDKNLKEAFLGLATVLQKQGKSEEALKYCNEALNGHSDYTEAYILSAKIYESKKDYINAAAAISKAIDLSPLEDSLYYNRAGFYANQGESGKAIEDYSKVIELNNHNYLAYFNRGSLYENNKNVEAATADYKSFLKLTKKMDMYASYQATAKQKIYDLNYETDKPEIIVKQPEIKKNGVIQVARNVKIIVLSAVIKDKSNFESIRINDEEVDFDRSENEINWEQDVLIGSLEKLTIQATDVYHNTELVTYTLERTEVSPPIVEVYKPYTSTYHEIFLEDEKPEMYIQGKVTDESLIHSITIAGVKAIFNAEEKNPGFSATINVDGVDEIVIEASDIYGNTTMNKYKLNRENARILSTNPMGKTWVVFIDNSDYKSFATLDGPVKDIETMRAAFSKYDIHNIIEKKNMTKQQMERFFAIELRDYVRDQKVNSLLVWYAGHGKFINETGYWIPVDAQRDEEFSYFNVNALKAYMQSYASYITHVLVVTDACESGPSFYAAMRGAKDRNCGDYASTKFKSSQVFSSAGAELAADNSPFTKTFARSLEYNSNDCIAIDNIVNKVTAAVSSTQKQSPKFGKINGLDDEDGTFFFIKKGK